MRKQIARIHYKGREKTLWGFMIERGKVLLYFKEYDIDFVRHQVRFFEKAGFHCKFKARGFHRWQKDNYTIWYRGTVEDCTIFLGELDKNPAWKVIPKMPVDEFYSIAILDCLDDTKDEISKYPRRTVPYYNRYRR